MCKRWHCGILAAESELASPSTLQRALAMGSHAFLSRPCIAHQVAGHSRVGVRKWQKHMTWAAWKLARTRSGWNLPGKKHSSEKIQERSSTARKNLSRKPLSFKRESATWRWSLAYTQAQDWHGIGQSVPRVLADGAGGAASHAQWREACREASLTGSHGRGRIHC